MSDDEKRQEEEEKMKQEQEKLLASLPLLQKEPQVDQESQYRQRLDCLPNFVGIYLSHTDAKIPTRAYADDVGYDLYAVEDVTIPVGCVCGVPVGICLALPTETFAQINARSNYGKQGILLHHGVLDPGYIGEISIWVMNLAKPIDHQGLQLIAPFVIKKGDKIGQLLFHKAERVDIKQISELPKTERGDKGHGSSGR